MNNQFKLIEEAQFSHKIPIQRKGLSQTNQVLLTTSPNLSHRNENKLGVEVSNFSYY